MIPGFYERLSLARDVAPDAVLEGYRRSLGELVRRLRKATAAGADTAALEAERDELREAFEVLSSPGRRRLYDSFLSLGSEDLPAELDGFWAKISDSMADPAAAAAVEVVRALTSLPVGQPLDRPRPAARPAAAPPWLSKSLPTSPTPPRRASSAKGSPTSIAAK